MNEKHWSKSTFELHVCLCLLRPGHEQCRDHTVQSFLPRWLSEEMALRPGDVSTLPLATQEPNCIRPQPGCICSQPERRRCSQEWGEKRRSASRRGEWRGGCKSCHISWRELLRPDPEHFITIIISAIYCAGIIYLCLLILFLFLTPEPSQSWLLVLAVSGTEKDLCRGFRLCGFKAWPAPFCFWWPVSYALPLSLLVAAAHSHLACTYKSTITIKKFPFANHQQKLVSMNFLPSKSVHKKRIVVVSACVHLREMSHIMALLMFGTLHRVPTPALNSLK